MKKDLCEINLIFLDEIQFPHKGPFDEQGKSRCTFDRTRCSIYTYVNKLHTLILTILLLIRTVYCGILAFRVDVRVCNYVHYWINLLISISSI